MFIQRRRGRSEYNLARAYKAKKTFCQTAVSLSITQLNLPSVRNSHVSEALNYCPTHFFQLLVVASKI